MPIDFKSSNILGGNTRAQAVVGALTSQLATGVVVRAFPGFAALDVRIGSSGMITHCVYAQGLAGSLFGVKDASLPLEGSNVLVWRSGGLAIAICAVANNISQVNMTKKGAPIKVATPGDDEEQWKAAFAMSSIDKVAQDPKMPGRKLSDGHMPFGSLPGEWSQYSDFGPMLAVKHFSAAIRGSPLAKMEFHAFDDFVRLVSAGRFEHVLPGGYEWAYDDGGFCTRERVVCSAWHELMGADEPRKQFTRSPAGNDETRKSPFQWQTKKLAPKPRMSTYEGALGDMFTMFTQNIRAEGGPWKWDEEKKTPGLSRMTLSGDGGLTGTFVGGVHLQRGGRIPVPKRLKAPWDPEGDKVDEGEWPYSEHKAKKAFDWSENTDYKYARNLQYADEEAWRSKLVYQRFDELKKDFNTPDEADLAEQKDQYDSLKSETKFGADKDRKCGIRLEPDGSVVIYDAFGGEIYMRGGMITFACPKDIMLMPGGQLVGMAADVVLKAKNSVDVSATDKDVRIACKQNLHMYTKEGGILLQSDADSDGVGFVEDGDQQGEDVKSKGVLIKCQNGVVGVIAQHAVVRFYQKLLAKAVTEQGQVRIIAESFSAAMSGTFKACVAEGATGLILGTRQVLVSAVSITIAAALSANIFKGAKILQPLMWAPVEDNVYDKVKTAFEKMYSIMVDEVTAHPITVNMLNSIKFTFRTARQYHTDQQEHASHEPRSKFGFAQPVWQFLKKQGYKLLSSGSEEKWKEDWDADGTLPWPGKDARDSALWTISQWKNVAMKDGVPLSNPRKGMDEDSGTSQDMEDKSLDEYTILR